MSLTELAELERTWQLKQFARPKILLRLRPIQVPVEEAKSADAVDGVGTIEKFDFCATAISEFVVESTDLGKLVRHPFIRSHTVPMPALDHEWTRCDKRGHLCVAERLSQIKLRHFVFHREQITIRRLAGGVLAN